MECSNFTLLVIIPIELAGILLVMMLFILDLTVTNGAINTFVFYFNIVIIPSAAINSSETYQMFI